MTAAYNPARHLIMLEDKGGRAPYKDYIEKAETVALGRALRALGYSAEFVRTTRRDSRRA